MAGTCGLLHGSHTCGVSCGRLLPWGSALRPRSLAFAVLPARTQTVHVSASFANGRTGWRSNQGWNRVEWGGHFLVRAAESGMIIGTFGAILPRFCHSVCPPNESAGPHDAPHRGWYASNRGRGADSGAAPRPAAAARDPMFNGGTRHSIAEEHYRSASTAGLRRSTRVRHRSASCAEI